LSIHRGRVFSKRKAARGRASAFTLQSWKTVKKLKEFLTTKAHKGAPRKEELTGEKKAPGATFAALLEAKKEYRKRRFFLSFLCAPSAPLWFLILDYCNQVLICRSSLTHLRLCAWSFLQKSV
jgi:hypothetical protein